MKSIMIGTGAIYCLVFAVPAHAEDTGLINHLNAQTRAQIASGLRPSETAEQRLQRTYREETNRAAENARKQGKSFVPVSYEQWKAAPAGTFEGYAKSYDGSGY